MRSMGAAAVFETAAETPPTVIELSASGLCVGTNCGAVADDSFRLWKPANGHQSMMSRD